MVFTDEPLEPAASQELLARAGEGDAAAFCLVIQPLERRLLRQAIAMTHVVSLAEDLVSETRVRAWKYLARYNRTCRLSTWLYGILLHCRQESARRARSRPISLASLPLAEDSELTKSFAWWKRQQDGLPVLLWVQTLVNESRLACALERYRLAHGQYPDTLEALAPQFIARAPRDIINGAALKYRRAGDGSFLLYSVGWNETDDGGMGLPDARWPEHLQSGDWVWQDVSKLN